VVLQLHGSLASRLTESGNRAFKLASGILLSLVDGIMVLSSEEKRQWQAFRRNTPVFTVKNPYTPLFQRLPKSGDFSISRNRVLFVGRLIEAKGIFDLVDALEEVLKRTQCELVIVGEGPHETDLRKRVDRLGLADHVTFAGYLSGSALMERYRGATVFALPTSFNEGFPTVLAEAMDAGLPIVTTPIRGAADYLVPGKNAIFVDSGDVKALSSAIVTLLADGELRARMAVANRDRIRVFEPHTVAAEYLEVLRAVA